MDPVYDRRGVTLYQADALTVLRTMLDSSVDAVVTDPPYGLADLPARKVASALSAWLGGDREHIPDGPGGFMGRAWDRFVPPPAVWDECLRVLKPGGHMLVFAGSRTADLMGMSIRLAGFEIRDTITWLYSAGFPKSLDVSKAIDRMAGVEREVIGPGRRHGGGVVGAGSSYQLPPDIPMLTAPATDAARQWDGWGTALKPSTEKVLVAHKPLSEAIFLARKPMDGTVAQTVLAHGTGGLNIAACRIATTDNLNGGAYSAGGRAAPMAGDERTGAALGMYETGRRAVGDYDQPTGRWPPNTVLSHSPLVDPATGEVVGDACADGCVPGCAVAELDRQSGNCEGGRFPGKQLAGPGSNGTMGGGWSGKLGPQCDMGDRGGASRFFPCFRWDSWCALRGMLSGCEGVSTATTQYQQPERTLDSVVNPASDTTSPSNADTPVSSPEPASTADQRLWTTQATEDGTARSNAQIMQNERNAQRVRSAANLCGSCATAIVQSAAAAEPDHDPASTLGLGYIAASRRSTLNRSLAYVAEDLANSDTTPTTTNLTTSCGYVVHVIKESIITAGSSKRSGSGRQSFIWESKAPAKERPRINGKSHSTIKPRRLIWWLVRLLTPPGGLVLDPFCGTGPVGWAARQQDMRAVLIDSDPACVGWVLARLDGWRPEDEPVVAREDGQLDLFSDFEM